MGVSGSRGAYSPLEVAPRIFGAFGRREAAQRHRTRQAGQRLRAIPRAGGPCRPRPEGVATNAAQRRPAIQPRPPVRRVKREFCRRAAAAACQRALCGGAWVTSRARAVRASAQPREAGIALRAHAHAAAVGAPIPTRSTGCERVLVGGRRRTVWESGGPWHRDGPRARLGRIRGNSYLSARTRGGRGGVAAGWEN